MSPASEANPSVRAQANLSALGLHEMASSLPDYVRMVAERERDFAGALCEMTSAEVRFDTSTPSRAFCSDSAAR